jgi:hypothetical protein
MGSTPIRATSKQPRRSKHGERTAVETQTPDPAFGVVA